MSWLTDHLGRLAVTLTEHASVEVTYSRPSTGQSVTFAAVPGLMAADRATLGAGARVRIDAEHVDFYFRPSLLVLGGVRVDPARGDRITIGTVVREVHPVDGQKAWERADVSGNAVLVHTIRVQ